ncbi:FAD-dependent oxidoreductase [bacterium]|nr:FAD-dependent oxidoreductase [bacterium]
MDGEDLSCEVLILGAGPAGCTAALYAARAGLRTVILSPSEVGGMMASAPIVGNFPGQIEPVPGREILTRIRQQALKAGAEHVLEAVVGANLGGEMKEVYAGPKVRTAPVVIIATGAMAPAKKAPGEQELLGRGVCYCAACDGPLYRDQRILVIGQDDQAAEEALGLSAVGATVCLATPAPELAVSESLREAVEARSNLTVRGGLRLEQILGEDCVTGARFRTRDGGEEVIEADGIFMYLRGTAPVTEFLYGQLETDEKGFLKTDEMCQTSLPGVFAVGDVRSKQVRQMVVACAEGCTAALTAERLVRKRTSVKLDRGEGRS